MSTNECKGCTREVFFNREELNHLLSKNIVDENRIVSDDMYSLRLDVCKNCSSLMYGSTCAHSGCLVEYRAQFSSKKCPNPAGAKW